MKRKITTLSSSIILVSISCLLIFIFYLSTNSKSQELEAIPVTFPGPFDLHIPRVDEKYLAYLPHSGFHNQRIELENALLLASYLKRTLLVPMVLLSNPAMPWLRYEKLYERLIFQTKNGLDHCVDLDKYGLPLPSECLNSFRWTNIPWTVFYNMSAIGEDIPLIFRNELSYEWMYENLDIQPEDIYFFKDMSPYEYQILDNKRLDDLPMTRFNYRIDVEKLQEIEHRVLHFGSMFGSYRVLAETNDHALKLKNIRSKMILQQPILSAVTARIVEKLGGTNNFIGMHLRVGDGIFKLRASILVDDIFHELVDKYTDLTVEQVADYEGGVEQHNLDRTESSEYEIKLRAFHPGMGENGEGVNYTKPIEVHHESTDNFIYSTEHFNTDPHISRRLTCAKGDKVTHRFRNTVLYIATDAPDPRNHPLLRKLFTVFPCTFILNDFVDDIEDVKRLEVVEERVKLESYLIPMIDAMVSAHGHTFFGTPHSTFTGYIEKQLNPIYTGQEVKVIGLEEFLEIQAAKEAA
ncbi:CigA protein [Mycotypha africana]|uniref:CigA protein n=1 Tax=Mycotypha africana TaxID=64632 RepID=UPI002301B5E8|nr:CigA protein [Mycotypha africana]KAI8991570.1 CigA protein [Mycotypha africana]